jgi:hypothetical protein
MNKDLPIYSKYRPETIALESLKMLQAEHEVYQDLGKDITKDDILNLRISLGLCETVDQFLGVI